MSAVDRRFYGVASAISGTMRLIGQMLSMGIAALVLAVQIGRVEITPERYVLLLTSMRVSPLLSAGLCVASMAASLARGRIR